MKEGLHYSVESTLPRRQFVKTLSFVIGAMPALCFTARSETIFGAPPQSRTPQQMLDEGPADAGWKTILTPPGEPGEPLIVRGTVFAADGKTPLSGARLYVYHTDAQGYYNAHHSFHEPPRIRGWMKTNAQGEYEFRTIKPASYPGQKIPAHIHPTVDAPGHPARWIDEYWFEGDPFLKPEDLQKNSTLGLFSQILRLDRDSSGVLLGVRHIRLL